MQAIELYAKIDQDKQIHLQLPDNVNSHNARVIGAIVKSGVQKIQAVAAVLCC